MNSRPIMTFAAMLLGLVGIVCLFAPAEMLDLYRQDTGSAPELLVQQLGAAFLGFAALNWISRGSVLGGIYGRPVVTANFTHFFVGSLSLIGAVVNHPSDMLGWMAVSAYVLLAIGFGALLFGRTRIPDAARPS